jgi:hypothetical protein
VKEGIGKGGDREERRLEGEKGAYYMREGIVVK